MAYALKYYWEKTVDNKVYRLEIHKKDSTSAAMEIGDVVQGLSLNIDGGEDNLDSPLLTSSLVMTFADAYDHPDSLNKKCGNWAEFYTPDATMWKVLLSVREAGITTSLWGGYVTPDSYEEDLTYGGSVTITARDNIGHLNDFPFDAEGDTITLRELVESAWAKIESPMRLTWANEWLQCEGIDAPDTHMNVAAFAEDSWHKAVEKALYGYGAVLRYKGKNEVVVCPLKSIPTVMASSSNEKEPTFVAGATRMLTPAVKRIEEAAQYDIAEGEKQEQVRASGFSAESGTYQCQIDGIEIDGVKYGTLLHDAPIWGYSLPESKWQNGGISDSLYFNPFAYEIGHFTTIEGQQDEVKRYMYLAANNMESRKVSFVRNIFSQDFTIKMQLGTPISLNRSYEIEQVSAFALKNITYSIALTQNGITQYYNGGGWQTSEALINKEYDPYTPTNLIELPISVGEIVGDAELRFTIWGILYMQTGYSRGRYGLYACIQDFSLCNTEGKSILSTNAVNTNYNEKNNVILSRSPEIAPAYNTVIASNIIKNGIFLKYGSSYQPAKAWAWQGFTPQQLAVYNHLQLLCYYAKPNNILEGTIVNGNLSQYGNIWKWEGKEHVLVAGRYDILTGYIDGAILREFTRYEDMWGDIEGVGFPDVEAMSLSNAEVGASASSTPQTYTNTTTVNIGTGGGGSGASYLNDLQDVDVEGVVAGSVLWFDGSNWVDRSLSGILSPYAKADDVNAALAKILDWFTLEDDVLHTKYNIASDEEISAHGINKGGGGGGSSYNRLDSWDAYDSSKAGYVLSAGLGYEMKVAVDTLNGYNLNTRVQNIETSYLNRNDGGFVNGLITARAGIKLLDTNNIGILYFGHTDKQTISNTDSAILKITSPSVVLEGFTTAEGDLQVSGNLSALSTLDVSNALTVGGWAKFNSGASVEGGNLVTKHDISVNKGKQIFWTDANSVKHGITYDESAKAFKLDGKFIATGSGASLTWGEISGKPSVLEFGGSSSQFLKADGSLDGTSYLSTSGGTISGELTLSLSNLHINNGNIIFNEAYYLNNSGYDLRWYNGAWNTLLHSGNYSDYALPLSGGTINGSLTVDSSSLSPLLINTSHSSGIGLRLAQNHTLKAEFNWDGYAGTYMYNHPSSSYIGVKDDGTPTYNGNPLIHSGNIGSQSVAYATSAGGIQGSTSSINFARGHNRLEMINDHSGSVGDFATSYQSGISVITDYVGWQMTSYGGDWENPYFRSLEDTGRWKPWRRLAFIDDNVASATKLATSRTIWGQSFDGTGNVSGDLSDVTFLKIRDYDYGIYKGNYFGSLAASDIVFYAPNLYFYTSRTSMLINSSGNVTIGESDSAGSLNRFSVVGGASDYANWADLGQMVLLDSNAMTANYLAITTTNGGFAEIQAGQRNVGAKNIVLQKFGGNVLIGTTVDSGEKLQVESSANTVLAIRGTTYPEASIAYIGSDGKLWTAGKGIMSHGDSFGFYSATAGRDIVRFTTEGAIINGSLNAGATTLSSLTVSGLSTFTGGVVAYDIHGNGQSLYLGNASNNAHIKVREDMVGSTSMWSIPRDGKAVFTSLKSDTTLTVTGETSLSSLLVSGNSELQGDLRLKPSGKDYGSYLKFGDGSFCYIHEDTDDHMKISARHGVTFETQDNAAINISRLIVGTNGMVVNSPATFKDFIYSNSIVPNEDNYYVLGTPSYKFYAVRAYTINAHEAIEIEEGKEIRFKDKSGAFHTLKYDSDKEAFVFDGNVNASGEISAHKLNA